MPVLINSAERRHRSTATHRFGLLRMQKGSLVLFWMGVHEELRTTQRSKYSRPVVKVWRTRLEMTDNVCRVVYPVKCDED